MAFLQKISFNQKYQPLLLTILVISLVIPMFFNKTTDGQHYIPALAMNIFTYVEYFYFIHCFLQIKTIRRPFFNLVSFEYHDNNIDECHVRVNAIFYFTGITFFRHFKYIFSTSYDPSGHIFVLGLQLALMLRLQKNNMIFVILGLWYYVICVFTELYYHTLFEVLLPLLIIVVYIFLSYSITYPKDNTEEEHRKWMNGCGYCLIPTLCYIGFSIAILAVDRYKYNWVGLIHDWILFLF